MKSDILRRLYTAIIFTGIVIGGLMLHPYTYVLLFLAIGVLAAYEFFRIVYGPATFIRHLGGIVTCCLPILAGIDYLYLHWVYSPMMYLPILLLWLFVRMGMELISNENNPVQHSAQSMFAMVYIGFPCLCAILIGHTQGTFSYLPLLGMIALIWANDTGAYLIGSKIGKHKLFPAVSPKKTVEGTLGGIIVTMILAWPMSIINSAFDWTQWTVIAAMIGIFGTIGDLFESKFKRFHQIKDTGVIMPGHGGILDRFDSFLFILPFVYFYIQTIK